MKKKSNRLDAIKMIISSKEVGSPHMRFTLTLFWKLSEMLPPYEEQELRNAHTNT